MASTLLTLLLFTSSLWPLSHAQTQTKPQSQQPPQPTSIHLETILAFGADAKTLVASVITLTTEPAPRASPVVSYTIACPTSDTADAQSCRAHNDFAKWEIWHEQGSVWGGTIVSTAGVDAGSAAVPATAPAATTTAWVCTLGDAPRGGGATGECTATIAVERAATTTTTTLDLCYVHAHQVPLFVTAGVEKLDGRPGMTVAADVIVAGHSSAMAALGCAATASTSAAGAATVTTASASRQTGASNGTATGVSSRSTGSATATASQTKAATGGGSASWESSPHTMGLVVVIACGILMYM